MRTFSDFFQVSDDERAKLLAAHEKNMAKYEAALLDEQARSRDALEAKLNARRNKRYAAEHAKLEKDTLLAEEERKRKEMLEHMDSVARQQQQQSAASAAEAAQAAKASSGEMSSASGGGPFTSAAASGGGGGEQQWINMLMASPLFQQISDLHDMLEKNAGPLGGSDFVLGG